MNYLSKLLLTALAVLALAAATNRVVDPYGIAVGTASEELQTGSLFDSHVRLAKAHIVVRYRPEAVVIGSSRAEIGLSPAHPGWAHERVYNLAVPHPSILELREYFEHAIAAGELKQVVLGLEFFQFNPLLEPQPDYDPCRLQNPGSRWSAWRASVCDLPFLLLSRRAFGASLMQLATGEVDTVYMKDGSRSDEAGERPIRSAGSQQGAFLESEARYFEREDLLRGHVNADVPFEEATAHHFDEILRLAHRHGIDLRMMISPSHARQWELIDQMELWDDFQRWKRYLLDASRRVADEFSAAPYPIWDFADYNAFSQEPMPPADDPDARMRWYWESSHFTRALGNLALDRVLSGKTRALGRRLEPDGFDAWLDEIAARRDAYRRDAKGSLRTIVSLSD